MPSPTQNTPTGESLDQTVPTSGPGSTIRPGSHADADKRGMVLPAILVSTANGTSMTMKLRFGHVSELSRPMPTIWPHRASLIWDKGRELETGRLSGGGGSAPPL